MKKTAIILGSVVGPLIVAAVFLHALPSATAQGLHHGASTTTPATTNETTTIKLNKPRLAVCGQPFFDEKYELTKAVFAVGAENVDPSDYENKVFAFIRTTDTLNNWDIDREWLVDHMKLIPRQTVDIVKEDPTVLDSCENFQAAISGPQ